MRSFLTVLAGVAASARVGSLIGSRSAAGARFAGHLSALASVLAGTIVMAVLLATKNVSNDPIGGALCTTDPLAKVFPFMFTDDRQVAQLVSRVMPLLASFQVGTDELFLCWTNDEALLDRRWAGRLVRRRLAWSR